MRLGSDAADLRHPGLSLRCPGLQEEDQGKAADLGLPEHTRKSGTHRFFMDTLLATMRLHHVVGGITGPVYSLMCFDKQ